MATWAQLTQEQRDEITALLTAQREWCGMMARLCALGRAITSKYAGNVETTLASLDAGSIPVYDASQGQETLTKDELINLAGYSDVSSRTSDGSNGSYYTNYHRALYVKAAGLYNTLQVGKA
jgi:hypothetical protein